jgi:diguanylate cyclase (GGDEF)-like protein/PAS domain S-box-containing protein
VAPRAHRAATSQSAGWRDGHARFNSLFRHSPLGLALVGPGGGLLEVNSALCAMLGYAEGELTTMTLESLTHEEDRETLLVQVRRLLLQQAPAGELPVRYLHRDGSIVWTQLSFAPVCAAGGTPLSVFLQMQDTTATRQAAEALAWQSMHDALTGLPNRTLLRDRLGQAILSARRDGTAVALLLMDLDRFKDINDALGDPGGDALLQLVGARLRGILRASDTVARLGGDEFALLLPAVLGSDDAVRAARKVLASLDGPLLAGGHAVEVGASVGIALYPEHGLDQRSCVPETLLSRAERAMYAAKWAQSGYAVYAAEQDQRSVLDLSLMHDLRRAITEDGLLLHYQPLVDVRRAAPIGVEALVRWPHPRHGLLSPDRFIPQAENSGVIVALTRWVLRQALRQQDAWRRKGLALTVAVNLSPRALHDPQLVATVRDLLALYHVAPDQLTVEITESALIADLTRAGDVLRALSALGVRIAIDDFGTGCTSLAYLTRFPVDQVKIDKSFVLDMAADAKAGAIVRSVIAMVHALGLAGVAEGVEAQEAWDMLAHLQCDIAQGYFMGRPLSALDLEHWMTASPWAARHR